MKPNALLVSVCGPDVIEPKALYEALSSHRVRAITDQPMDQRFKQLPNERWFGMNAQTAFHTPPQLARFNRLAVNELLRLLGPAQFD